MLQSFNIHLCRGHLRFKRGCLLTQKNEWECKVRISRCWAGSRFPLWSCDSCTPWSLAEITWGSEIIVTKSDLLQKFRFWPRLLKMKNGIMGYVSFFTVFQLNSTAVKILYLENICIFHKYIFSSGWHNADFLDAFFS